MTEPPGAPPEDDPGESNVRKSEARAMLIAMALMPETVAGTA
jgi:hypothetical protein